MEESIGFMIFLQRHVKERRLRGLNFFMTRRPYSIILFLNLGA